ncbi:MAG TPA: NTP transferase domain-containing protein [Saprospiraceae bacterium]|nr:NTP transferase domain-containing protein [Saprospiraceae bacterium]
MEKERTPSTGKSSLKGLVLAGGESTRMGADKGLLEYHGMPQREYLLRLLKGFTTEAYISCKPGQIRDGILPLIEDRHENLGPFGGILSAFEFDPQAAWLVVACDFPLLDHAAISQLVEERDLTSIATSFLDTHTLMPEPWITILEPRIYPILQDYHSRGRSSLRGVLVDFNSALIRANNPHVLLNANTPEEEAQIRKMISH